MAGAARPKLIGLVADVSARTQFILPNEAHINSLPFDGIVVNIPQSWSSMSPGATFTEADVRTWLDPLKNFNAGKENYLAMHIDRPGSLFDDAVWAQVAQNWKTVARIAAEAGFKGIFFDNEEYAAKWQNYPENVSPEDAARGLAANQAMASQRGRELMSAVAEVMPNAKVAVAHGPYLSVPKGPGAPAAMELQAGGSDLHELRGPFFTGFLEALGPNQTLIDGGELYALRTAQEFKESFDYRNTTLPQRIDWQVRPDALGNWATLVAQGHMVYTDEFPKGYDHTPETLVDTLLNAFDNSEEAVVLYSETAQVNWLTPNAGNVEWIAAARRAVELADNTQRGTTGNDMQMGTAKADRLLGNDGNDRLTGGAGADLLDGGNGSDTASYLWSSASVTVNLQTGKGAGGDAQGDSYTAIELVFGSAYNDVLTAGAGGSTLYGFGGNDTLNGGAGNDVFDGGAGADSINGGAGTDVAYFTSTSPAISINLATNVNTGGEAQGDVYTDVENVVGTSQNDTIIGNALNNTLYGGAGNDRLGGGAGADGLVGGSGSDTFVFAAGDSGQTIATRDRIYDFGKGASGIGDRFDFSSVLAAGGVGATATTIQASINQGTGVATFAAGSGTTLADALADIATSMTTGGNAAGEFALFRVNNAGDHYLFISDGAAGVTANDVLIFLSGVSTVNSIALDAGDLNILT
jgi:hypothetical protein